jgi:TonB family protein
MRFILAASLLLSPMLYAASAAASQPRTDASAANQLLRISSGVTVPAVLDSTDVHIASDANARLSPVDSKVVVNLWVDAQGKPQGVRVVKSLYPDLDAHVVAAVRQFHFHPAKLDNQPVAQNMDLVVSVKR